MFILFGTIQAHGKQTLILGSLKSGSFGRKKQMAHSINTYGNIILPLQCSGKKRGRDTNMADIIAAPAVGPDSLIHGFNDIPYSFN
jgi:hypothetical protein